MPTDNAFHIYVDETSKGATYMAVGALFTRRDSGRDVAEMIQGKVVEFEQRPDKELHWSALTRHLLPLYTAVGTALIDCTQIKPYRMRYHAMMIESAKIDRSINEGLNREQVLERFIFALIFNFAHNFGPITEYHVFIDSKTGEEASDEALRAMLNNRCFTRFKKRTDPFHTVKYVRSENSRLIQGVDLISGAIAYETNSLHQAPNPAKHRLDLWSSMLQASKLATFAQPTTDRMNRFQILHFDFDKSAAKRFKPLPSPMTTTAIDIVTSVPAAEVLLLPLVRCCVPVSLLKSASVYERTNAADGEHVRNGPEADLGDLITILGIATRLIPTTCLARLSAHLCLHRQRLSVLPACTHDLVIAEHLWPRRLPTPTGDGL